MEEIKVDFSSTGNVRNSSIEEIKVDFFDDEDDFSPKDILLMTKKELAEYEAGIDIQEINLATMYYLEKAKNPPDIFYNDLDEHGKKVVSCFSCYYHDLDFAEDSESEFFCNCTKSCNHGDYTTMWDSCSEWCFNENDFKNHIM